MSYINKTILMLIFFLIFNSILFSNEKISLKKAQKLINNQHLMFIENKGQIKDNNGNYRPEIKYYIKGKGLDMYFGEDGVSYVLYKKNKSQDGKISTTMHRVDLKFNPEKDKYNLNADEMNVTTYSFNKGQSENIQNVHTFSKLIYKDVYKGIDVVYYPTDNNIKYDIIVNSGSDPNEIKLVYEGQESLQKINSNEVIIGTTVGNITEKIPISYQMKGDLRENISTDYKVDNNSISFDVENYDKTKQLVIDPVIEWTKFIGGSGEEIIGRYPNTIINNMVSPNSLNFAGGGIVSNSMDTIYVTGSTNSTDFPWTSGISINYYPDWDMFIQSYDKYGNLYHSHSIGSSSDDFSTDIAINRHGRPVIVGATQSSNIYVTSGLQNYIGQSGYFDMYVYEYDLFSGIRARCIGGTDNDFGRSIDIDDESPYDIYLIGDTRSWDFELVNCTDCFLNGTTDATVVKLDSNLNTVWTTYFGGDNDETGMGLDHRFGEVAIVGATNSETGFPLVNQPCYTGPLVKFNHLNNTIVTDINKKDGFVARLDDATNAVIYSDYKGGKDDDYLTDVVSISQTPSPVEACQDINVPFNNLILVGFTKSDNTLDSMLWQPYKLFKPYDNGGTNDKGDGWIIRQDNFAQILNEYYAGSGEDVLTDVELSQDGTKLIVAGYSESEDLWNLHAEQVDINQGNSSGKFDAILASFDFDLEPQFATFNGSSNDDYGVGAAFNYSDMPFLLGETNQSTYPAIQFKDTLNTYQSGGSDAFLTSYKAVYDNESTLLPTFYGGDDEDFINDIATDYYDNFYITGSTKSSETTENFPVTTGAYDVTYNGNKDIFVSKFNRLGRHLWTTYLGGSGDDEGTVLKVVNDYILDSADIFVAGKTTSTGLGVGDSAYYLTKRGTSGGFLARLSNDGTDLKALTYLYTTNEVVPYGIDISKDKHVYVCGMFNVSVDTWASFQRVCNSPYNGDLNKWNYNSIYCFEDNLTHQDRLGIVNSGKIGFVTKWDFDLSLDWGNWIANDSDAITIAYDVSVLDDKGWVALVGTSDYSRRLFPNQWVDGLYGDSQNSYDDIQGDADGWVMVIKDADSAQYAAWGTLIEGEFNNSLENVPDIVNNVEWLEQPGQEYDLIIGGHSEADNEIFDGFAPTVIDTIDEKAGDFDIFTMRFDVHVSDPDWWVGTRVAFWGASEHDYLVDLYSHESMDTIALIGTTKSTNQNKDVDFTDYYSYDEFNDNYAKYHAMVLITDPNFNYIRGTFVGDDPFGTVTSYTAQDVIPSGIVIQDDGELLFSANTSTTDFGLNSNVFQPMNAGMTDGLIVRLNEDAKILSKLSPYLTEDSIGDKVNFSLFPNPVVNNLKINSTNHLKVNEINIYNVLGKKVLNIPKYIDNIDVSDLTSGVYYIEFVFGGSKDVLSFIKK